MISSGKLRLDTRGLWTDLCGVAVLTGTALEADIQAAWGQARSALPCADLDPQKVIELVTALRDCAERASAIGFASGERELLRMAGYLEGRLSPTEYRRYRADGSINA